MNITGNPVKFEKSNYKKNMITQMTQPVKRKYDVLLERSGGENFTERVNMDLHEIKLIFYYKKMKSKQNFKKLKQ